MDPVAQLLVVVAGLLLIGALGEFIFARTGIPDVIWLVLAGIIAGPVFEVVSPRVLEPAVPFFGAIALTIILSGGASRLRLTEVVEAAPRGLSLAAAGFLFSVASIYGYFWILTEQELIKPLSPILWLTAGAIVGGNSALILMPTLAGAASDAHTSHLLEVESSGTDAFGIVMTMVLIDLLVNGATDLARPFYSLGREIGLGVIFGCVGAAVLVPTVPTLRHKTHGYTVFVSAMLILYALTHLANGNGAMAVLTSAVLIGNASTIVPKLIPGASPESFFATEIGKVMQDQITFLIKSFFFVLIGLMFPTSPRLMALGAIAALVLLLARIPAVKLSTMKLGLTRKQTWLLIIAIPRGLAAGVLATLPFEYGVAGSENLSRAVFALIVTSILLFAVGFAIVSRMSDEKKSIVS